MASSLHVPVLLLAALAMTPTALKSYLAGGLQDTDSNAEDVQQAVEFALQEYNSNNSDPYLSRLVRVVRARQQVVAGINYYLDLEIGRTTCAKDKSTQDDCSFSGESTQLCSFVVYFRPWEDYKDLTSSSCHSA
ncbi:cystatin-C-like [Cavia porcellus]|uniref:cystatin-C-like n=1 Tax=Cavia porcellus TaxID=10141 RepID=UPI00022B7755|nr:cystatin-C-like [Cavia porcellus]